MNIYSFVLFIFLLCPSLLIAQDNSNMPVRTPELEATRQTEKLKQELNLSPEQVKQAYEINLHYAKLRQTSNSRTEAMERVKRKNADLKRILNTEQYDKLQNKHYERSTYQIPDEQQRPVRTNERSTEQAPRESESSSRSNAGTPASRSSEQPATPARSNRSQQDTTRPTTQPNTNSQRPTRTPATQPGSRTNSTPTTRPSVRPTTQPNRRPTTQPSTRSSRTTNSYYYQRPTTAPRPSSTYRPAGTGSRSSAPASYPGRSYSTSSSRSSNSGSRR